MVASPVRAERWENLLRSRRVILSLAAALLIASANAYRVDWVDLEQAWSAYLAAPSTETAARIQALLPLGKRASHHVTDFDAGAAIRILDRLGELQPLVDRGEPHAYEVAFALREISDGDYSERLSEMLGASARTHPVELLRSLKANRERHSRSCDFAAAADPDRFSTTEKYRAEIAARREAIAAVHDAALEEPRSCLRGVFDRALARS